MLTRYGYASRAPCQQQSLPSLLVPLSLLLPIVVKGVRRVLAGPPRRLVGAARNLLDHQVRHALGRPSDLEAPDPLEPCEVVGGPSRRDPVESVQELHETGMQGVHPVYPMLRRLGGNVLSHVLRLQRLYVGVGAVGRDDRPGPDPPRERLGRPPLAHLPAPHDLVEDVAGVVYPGEDAYALAQVARFRALAGLPRYGGAFRVAPVALEAFRNVALVHLDSHARLRPEGGDAAEHGLEDAVPHEEGGLEGHPAPLRRFPEREEVYVALREPHPDVAVELRGGEDGIGRRGERPAAASAEPALRAGGVSAPLHDMGAFASRTRSRVAFAIAAAQSEIEHVLVDYPLELL